MKWRAHHTSGALPEYQAPQKGVSKGATPQRRLASPKVYLRGTNLTNEEARFQTSFLHDIALPAGAGVTVGLNASS
jgi:hypothetical protein